MYPEDEILAITRSNNNKGRRNKTNPGCKICQSRFRKTITGCMLKWCMNGFVVQSQMTYHKQKMNGMNELECGNVTWIYPNNMYADKRNDGWHAVGYK